MQIQTSLRFHLTPVRINIIKNTNNNRCWWGCEEKGTLYTACGNASSCYHLGKQYGGFIKN
jgi:hypothetical protein